MAPGGLRRSSRVPRELPILLFGSDTEGRTFSEETRTVVVSRHGAGIISQYKFSPEQELLLRRLDTNTEAELRVVGQIGAHGGTYTYGVAFLNEHPTFWGIAFPPLSEAEQAATRAVLECVRCDLREEVHQSDLEADVLLINDGIVRYCRNCNSSTFWKRAPEGSVAAPVPPPVPLRVVDAVSAPAPPPPAQSEPAPVSDNPAERYENRRKHVRTKIRCQACIRSFQLGEDVVKCEDMSRGGIRFTTRQKYSPGMKIQLAVPYSPGSQAIFVDGLIVYVTENPRSGKFQCGVQFIGGVGR